MKMLIGAALALAFASQAGAQVTPPDIARQQQQEIQRGDPPRWSQPDRSEAAQLATLRKEIHAALREALEACKQQGADTRSACVQEARATHHSDLANLRQIHMASRDMSRTFETSGK